MDLREYAKQIAQEKISVQRDLENNCKYFFTKKDVCINLFYDIDLEHVQSFVDLHTEIQVNYEKDNAFMV